jgi:hypothetical protein
MLVESLASALETMAFVSLMPPEDAEVPPPPEALRLSVEFRGERMGRLDVVTTQNLGRLLVDNTLACGDETEPPVLPNPVDPLVELLNITCGMVLRQLVPHGRIEMRVPKVAPFDAENDWKKFIASGADVVLADGNVIAIRMIDGA